MRRVVHLCLVITILFSLLTPMVSATGAMDTPQTTTSYGIDSDNALLGSKQMFDTIKSAFLYERNSGTVMYAWKADEQVYPSSLVKIMTALLAVEKGNLAYSPNDFFYTAFLWKKGSFTQRLLKEF